MDSKGFFLGLIAAIVLFLLWKKEQGGQSFFGAPAPASQPSSCAGCGANPPSYAAAPAAQLVMSSPDGFISPGTPPLNSAAGPTSFYADSGPTPWSGFLFASAPDTPVSSVNPVGPPVANSPGSPTTPSNIVPLRAVQPVPSTSQQGFQQRYNVVGIPRTAGARYYIN